MKNQGESFFLKDEGQIDSLRSLVKEKREELAIKSKEYSKSDKYTNRTESDNSEQVLINLEREIEETEGKIKEIEDLKNKGQFSETFLEKKRREQNQETSEETGADENAEQTEESIGTDDVENLREPEKESLKGLLERITTEDRVAKEKIEKREGTDKEQAERLEYQLKLDTEYYKILRETTEKISGVTSFDDLCNTLSKMEGLQGSQDYFPSELLIKIIKEIEAKDPSNLATFDQLMRVTRTAGLRFKVSELLSNKLQQKIEGMQPEEFAEAAKEEDKNWQIVPYQTKEIDKVLKENPEGLNQNPEGLIKFEDLSNGQQAYVTDKIENIKLSRTKELADRKFDVDLKNSGWFKKIVLGSFKRFNVAKTEKELANEGESVTEAEIQEIYKLARGMKIETQLGGRYRIDFLNGLADQENSEEIKKQDEWNSELTKWSRIPKEWEFESASPSERKQFEEAKEQYEKTRTEILNHLATKNGGEGALKQFALIESQMELNKFMSENPDAMSALDDIKNQSTFGRALKDIAADIKTERGLYTALGFGTRFAVGTFGIIAAPLVAIPLGALSARYRAKEALKIDSKKTRRNYSEHVVDKNSEEAGVLSSKLELLINNYVSNEGNPEKQKAILDKLKTRLKYTQDKMEYDLVNYGDTEQRLSNQFKLMKLISSAQYIGIKLGDDKYNDYWKGQVTEERLNKLMAGLFDKFNDDRKLYVRNKIIRGAVFAAGFATLGSMIAHWYQDGGDGIFKGGNETVSGGNKPTMEIVPPTPDSAHKAEMFTNIIDDKAARASGRVRYDSVWHSIWEIASKHKKELGLPENISNDKLNTFVHNIWLNSPANGRDIVQNGDKVFLKISEKGAIVTGLLRKGK